MTLPEAFITDMAPHLPAAEMESFVEALTATDASTSIRLNQRKLRLASLCPASPAFDQNLRSISWNEPDGRYLSERPQFTLDPLLHAGAYYVQEASSQFVTHILRSLLPADQPVTMLDLCAAPGGKSTAALSVLPEGSLLVCNEIDRRRARILSENVTKWGMPNVIVTGNAPADFTPLTHLFDVILTDVPCSGEGMFRKDPGAVNDWSPAKVKGCVELQKQILSDIWPALKPGGWLIYGTCTFNVHEDEEQLRFLCEELGAIPKLIPVPEEWHIHGPLLDAEQLPCYRFMPHYTQGEGLFMAVLQKLDDEERRIPRLNNKSNKKEKKGGDIPVIDLKRLQPQLLKWVKGEGMVECTPEGILRFIPSPLQPLHSLLSAQGLYLLQSGIELGTVKGRDVVPAHALAMSIARDEGAFPCVDLALNDALQYLRHEAITLPQDAPTGYVLVTYADLPLGFVKNMGNRSNNLYPNEWRIRFS